MISGDALTDVDLRALLARHQQAGGVATLAVKRIADTRDFGVVLHDSDGRITGFQEKPEPAEAKSDLGNCGIYLLEPDIFDHFLVPTRSTGRTTSFRSCSSVMCRSRSARSRITGATSARPTNCAMARSTRCAGARDRTRRRGDRARADARRGLPPRGRSDDRAAVWIGRDVRIGERVRLHKRLVIGDSVRIGDGASLRDSVLLPGTQVDVAAILIGAIAGHAGIIASLPPRGR